MVHSINLILAIFDNFTIQKTRKYLKETKTFNKIPIVFKNSFPSVREKLGVEKKKLALVKNNKLHVVQEKVMTDL